MKIGVMGCIIENPQENQAAFNELVAEYRHLIKGRMGIPFDDHDTSVIAITVIGSVDDINALTGRLGNIPGVSVKASISRRDID